MTARLLACTPDNIALAAAALAAGDVVGAPTETVYGLAGLAFDPAALAKIFAVKERPTFDPLIVHAARPAAASPEAFDWLGFLVAERLVDASAMTKDQSRIVGALASRFWPGPLTIVLPKQTTVPDLATSGLATVAVRAPARAAMQALIRAAGGPLAAPSANRFGRISPTSARDVWLELGDRLSIILDDGPCPIGLESTIVQALPSGQVELLRSGAVTLEELERAVGQGVAVRHTSIDSAPLAPGALPSHYAPRKPLFLLPSQLSQLSEKEADALRGHALPAAGLGLLVLQGDPATGEARLREFLWIAKDSPIVVRSLTVNGDEFEAARNLFSALRELDDHPATEVIFAEPAPSSHGLWRAIADRLSRAVARVSSP